MSRIKNILDKLRPDYNDNKQVKSVERIAAIGHTSEAIGWRPVSYENPESYRDFLANLDSNLDSFISQANPDRYNAEYYVEIIEAACNRALEELHFQKVEHNRSIHNIDIYQLACLNNLELDLQCLEDALAKKKEVIR